MIKLGKGLFSAPVYKKYGDMVSFESTTAARKSVADLKKEFNEADTANKQLRIARVAQYAANRARASTNRKHLSPDVKKRFTKMHKIYSDAADTMFSKYGKHSTEIGRI
jgi:hypothetical protein